MKIFAFLTVFVTISSVSAITEAECANQIMAIITEMDSTGGTVLRKPIYDKQPPFLFT
jgi:hypothetical protein